MIRTENSKYVYSDEQLILFPFLLMWIDCATIEAIIKVCRKPIVSLGMLPYFTLACCSVSEFTGWSFEGIAGVSSEFLPSIRNNLKLWQDRYSRVAKGFLQTDDTQNGLFRDRLRFEFTKSLNIHYNLGIFFDQNGNVVGNTQFSAHLFGFDDLSEEECAQKSFEIGKQAGAIIGSTLAEIRNTFEQPVIALNDVPSGFFYCDLNTNTTSVFPEDYPKEISLSMLHLLSLAGFVDHVILSIVPCRNPWAMRVLYVAAHYCQQGLARLKNSLKNNEPEVYQRIGGELERITSEAAPPASGSFRNCMMHYDLYDKKVGDFLIKPEYLDRNDPMYGLVQSCFDGESYESVMQKLRRYLSVVEEFLKSQFDFSKAVIRRFDDE